MRHERGKGLGHGDRRRETGGRTKGSVGINLQAITIFSPPTSWGGAECYVVAEGNNFTG